MCVVDVIRESREELGLQQKDLARALGVSHSAYSAYERRTRTIPDDIVMRAAAILKNPKILGEHGFEKQTEFFNVPVLDGVDDYPVVVIDSLLEEAVEMMKALVEVKKIIKNKKSEEQLTEQNKEELEAWNEQVGDVYAALKMYFISMRRYGVDVKIIEKRCNQKLVNKGYVLKNRHKKSALRGAQN